MLSFQLKFLLKAKPSESVHFHVRFSFGSQAEQISTLPPPFKFLFRSQARRTGALPYRLLSEVRPDKPALPHNSYIRKLTGQTGTPPHKIISESQASDP